jgi:uncharacterized membrane protein YsdA (DUF1294 family)/cold shock CspA family protein
MRIKGKIAFWNNRKGYGFIAPNDGGKQIFVHIKAFASRQKLPKINQVVSYTVSADKQGRPCASEVTRVGEKLPKGKIFKKRSKPIIGAAVFLVIVGVSTVTAKIPFLILPLYLLASLFTFIIYAMDKSAAKSGAWRTQESTLHLLSLIGGWPGAMVAQQKLRHKSKKLSFRLVFWLTVLINIGAFIWWHTPAGVTALRTFISNVL